MSEKKKGKKRKNNKFFLKRSPAVFPFDDLQLILTRERERERWVLSSRVGRKKLCMRARARVSVCLFVCLFRRVYILSASFHFLSFTVWRVVSKGEEWFVLFFFCTHGFGSHFSKKYHQSQVCWSTNDILNHFLYFIVSFRSTCVQHFLISCF